MRYLPVSTPRPEGRPRQHAEAERLRGGQHLVLDRAGSAASTRPGWTRAAYARGRRAARSRPGRSASRCSWRCRRRTPGPTPPRGRARASVSSTGRLVGPDVHLPQVDVVDAEARAATRRACVSRVPREVSVTRSPGTPRDAGLRGQHDLVAGDHVADQRADQLLAGAVAVAGGGVDQGPAGLDEGDAAGRAPRARRCRDPRSCVPRPRRETLSPVAPTERCCMEVRRSHGACTGGRSTRRGQAHPPVIDLLKAVVLGIIQGLTEFLPISSSAHLRIFPELFGWGDPGAAFTAVIQIGTELAVLIYFRKDIWRIGSAWVRSLFQPELPRPRSTPGWAGTSSSARCRSWCSACCSRTSSRTTSATSGSSAPR